MVEHRPFQPESGKIETQGEKTRPSQSCPIVKQSEIKNNSKCGEFRTKNHLKFTKSSSSVTKWAKNAAKAPLRRAGEPEQRGAFPEKQRGQRAILPQKRQMPGKNEKYPFSDWIFCAGLL